MKYLKSDADVRLLRSPEQVNEYFRFRKNNDRWVITPINTCSVRAVENNPIFAALRMQELNILNTEEVNFSNMECVSESGLFLKFPLNGTSVTIPTRFTAFRGLLERAGLSGITLTNYDRNKKKEVLPIHTKAEWLSAGLSLYGADTKILIRDEKVTAMLSEDYAILPAYELVPILEEKCKEAYPAMSILEGRVTHEYFTIEYRLNDEATNDSFKNLLLQMKAIEDKDEISCGIVFVTSDVGLSRAAAYPMILIDQKMIRFGKGISLLHKGDNDVASFGEIVKTVSSLFDEAEDQIESLGNTAIPDIKACAERIVEENKGVFSKRAAESVLYRAKNEAGTAIDVYFLLYDIAEAMSSGKDTGYHLNCIDSVSKFLYADYRKYL